MVWLTDERRSALFPAGTIVRDPQEFDIPSHFLKRPDPLLEVPSILRSVSVFLLSGHLEFDQI